MSDAHLSLAERVDAACDRFEAQWRSGQRPRIEDYLAAAPAADRDALRAALAGVEMELQLRTAPTPRTGPVPSLPPDSAVPDQACPALAGYDLLGELGRGGMGVVYLARQVRLKRYVALKMILAEAQPGPQALERFRVEAEAVARLQHPNIVQIYEVGEADGRPYLALEFVNGGSLAGQLAGTPLPPHPAARLVETLARAMHAAHQRGIVHRDLKPANVLLAGSGDTLVPAEGGTPGGASRIGEHTPKITDFGLAKILGEDSARTRSGQVLGTPSYMAPEQAAGRGSEIGPRTDVYALGAILYELLTGRPPFKGATALETLDQLRAREPVSPSGLQPGLPPDLETICLRCLQKLPGQRYASAQDLADDLRRFLGGRPIQARPVGMAQRAWRWCRRNPTLAALSALASAALVAVVAVAFGFSLFQSRAADDLRREQGKTRAALDESERLSARLALARGLAECEQEHVGAGLLWLVRSLEIATRLEDADLQRAIRANLTGWRGRLMPVRASLPHRANVNAVAFSPDGRTLLAGDREGVVGAWDVATARRRDLTLRHPAPVLALAVRRDGKTALTGCADNVARLWALDRAEELRRLEGHSGEVRAVAFSPDGRTILTGSHDATARLWDAATGKEVRRLLGHRDAVWAVAFSPDGKSVLTGSMDGTARLWDAATGAEVRQLRGCGEVYAAAFRPDGKAVLTAGSDMTAQLWDIRDAARSQPLWSLRHDGDIFAAAFSPDGRTIVTGSTDQTARLWDAATGKAAGPALPHQDQVWAVAFSPDGKKVLTGCGKPRAARGEARLWEVAGPPLRRLLPHPGGVVAAAFRPDGKTVLTGGTDGIARLWDPATGQELRRLQGHTRAVRAVAFSPDGTTIVTGGTDGTARLWEGETGRCLHRLCGHTDEVRAAVFGPDGRLVLTGSWDGTVRLWSVATGEEVRCFARTTAGDMLRAVAFHPDGRTVLAGGLDWTVRSWDVATGRPRDLSFPHKDTVSSVAVSRDGKMVLTASFDRTARLWDAATGEPLGPLLAHPGKVYAAALAPAGDTIVLAGSDRTARLWDAATRTPLGPPLPHQAEVWAAAFSLDGRTVVTGSDSDFTQGPGEVRLWEIPAAVPGEVEQIKLWAQTITAMELDGYDAVQILDADGWRRRCQDLEQLGGPPLP
jgi:WD40 repeat protein/serine/threonine protein kinase